MLFAITFLQLARENERRLQLLIDHVPARIAYVDAKERYVTVNYVHEMILGLTRSQITGEKIETILGQENYLKVKTHIRDALNGKQICYETSFIGANGETQWVEVNYIPDIHPQTGVMGFYDLTLDLTEKKRVEQEQIQLQAQLHQVRKMESVGRLAGGVAHDFNNMLGVILGHTEMALEWGGLDEMLSSSLQEIDRAARRSANLTQQLLGFARKQAISPQVIDLNKTVTNMLQMIGRLIGENITLSWFPASTVWPVKIDPSQVDQILANLCVNARDAIGKSGRVVITTKNCSLENPCSRDQAGRQPGDYVLLKVNDDGCGMDTKVLENIFEPFFTTKDVGQGTGLGLSTVYGIIRQNEGFLDVDSQPGKGTIFSIYFPRHRGKLGRIKKEKLSTEITTGHETILLVEDEPTILEMTQMMLQRLGYTVIGASRPDEALELAEAHGADIDMFMTDVIMPQMNGQELARKLRHRFPNLKGVFMSGYTSDVIADHGVLDEGVHFIHKPFSMQELGCKLREVLDKK